MCKDSKLITFLSNFRCAKFKKILYFEWSPPIMTFIRFNIGISSGIPPGHWQICKQAIAFFLLCDLLAGLPLHSRMSPGVTACSSGCKPNMPRHVGVPLHHSCHVACSAAWKTNIPRHVGDHLNHSCHVGCTPYQAYLVTFYLAHLLAFYLAYLLTFYLAHLLAFYLAIYLAYLLAFLLTFYLAFYLANLLAFYLANILALYLAYLLTFYLA